MANPFSGENNFQSYMTYRPENQELSESRYNLTIGAALSWGFFLNYLILKFAGPAIINMVYTSSAAYTTFLIVFLVGYFALAFIGSALVRSENPVQCFLGYNLIAVPVGIVVTMCVIGYDTDLVINAVLCTAVVTLSMMIISTIFPHVFTRMGSGLGIALLGTILVEGFAMLLFGLDLTILDWIVVAIMCLYIGYDWVRANSVQRTTTNAIAAASALYLDIINIFIRMLRILSRGGRRRN